MKISTKARYALRIMIDMAQHNGEGYIPLKTIAERQNISKRYLDQIMLLLNKTDFLLTAKGAQGGYMLAKEADNYTLADIINATEGGFAPLSCLESNSTFCENWDNCIAKEPWSGLYEVMTNYLNNITLQDILNKHSSGESYNIPCNF